MLKKPFKPNEVQWRITATGQNERGLAVAYLDSRAIQNRLDEVVGWENWQNEFTAQPMMKDNAFICEIRIYFPERGEWISKSNGAGSTDIEPIKGGLSDAFKRTASMWGIGRYLYQLDGVWVKTETFGKSKVIAKDEKQRLEKIYIEAVKKLFPKSSEMPNPAQSQVSQPASHIQIATEQVAQPVARTPIYTIVNAKFNKTHTVIELSDGVNPATTVYFNGEAKLAKNQRITDVIVHKRNSGTAGDYFVLETFRIADTDSPGYQQAA